MEMETDGFDFRSSVQPARAMSSLTTEPRNR
jgi:hypothetical protein